ncbi:hypothetical protein ABG067_005915 [Albugo candida]
MSELEGLKPTCLSARVSAAPAIGGAQMFRIKLTCKGKSCSLYKTKDDFKNVLSMLKLVQAMSSRNAQSTCELCADCNAVLTLRSFDVIGFDEFLNRLLAKARDVSPQVIELCSSHRGVIQVLKDFLGIRDGKCLCQVYVKNDCLEVGALSTLNPAQDDEEDNILLHTLSRSLSEQFAALDSVC